MKAATAFVAGETFQQEVQWWVRVQGSDNKQLVTRKKPVRPWWWRNDVGRLMLSVRAGDRLLGDETIAIGPTIDA
jgi:hypothetical protein